VKVKFLKTLQTGIRNIISKKCFYLKLGGDRDGASWDEVVNAFVVKTTGTSFKMQPENLKSYPKSYPSYSRNL
jgi:hypothetical protein